MMSFSAEVKEEIASLVFERHCVKAFLVSALKNIGNLTYTQDNWAVTLKTQSPLIAEKLKEMIQETFPKMKIILMLKDVDEFRKKPLFNIIMTEDTESILEFVQNYEDYINMECCKRAFLAGAFLTGGSVNSPEKTNYHIEFQASEEGYAKKLKEIFLSFGIAYKTIIRRNKRILYLKKSEHISDTLKLIGCTDSVFKFENVRMQRDIHNSLNRLNNIDISNQQKTLQTGMAQQAAIELLKSDGRFDTLKEKEQNICNIRLTHVEYSLSELVDVYYDMYREHISKSTIHNALKKIEKLAQGK